MPKEANPSKPGRQKGADSHSSASDPAWTSVWAARGWVAPDRADWTDPFQSRRLSLYASALKDKFGFVRFMGLPTQGGPEDTPIEALFVEPALSGERVDPGRPVDDWPKTFGLIDALIDHPRLVVLGDPGCGKSTLVNWVVLSLLSREENRLKRAVGSLLPVTLVLRDLDIAGEITWDKLLARFVAHPTGQALGSPETIISFLQSGQAMVLVDGLDEAGDAATRRTFAAVLQSAFRQFQSVRWVITSRVVGYDDAPIEFDGTPQYMVDPGKSGVPVMVPPLDTVVFPADFPTTTRAALRRLDELGKEAGASVIAASAIRASRLYLTPFDNNRISMFVRNWHEQHETIRAERSIRSAELIEALDRSPQVKGLARIPNLLTMIALVYRVYLRLPDGRALLYERIAQAYLETIETARKLPTPGHTLEDMKRWLGYAAFQMQRARFAPDANDRKDHGILISRDDLVQHFVFAMSKGNTAAFNQNRPTAVAFVDWVARRAGLVIPRSEDLFAFAHLSFQEYFAAWFIAEQITGPSWNKPKRTPSPLAAGTELEALKAATRDARWHETIVLLFELLAVRGEWADEVLEILFAPGDDAVWSGPSSDGGLEKSGTRCEMLLVLLARDKHSGLSAHSRAMAFRRAWIFVGEVGRRMRDHGSYFKIELAGRLLESEEGRPSPAMEVLAEPPVPFTVDVLVLNGVATDVILERLLQCRLALPNLRMLRVAGTRVTDAGVKELARAGTGLQALNTLNLGGTHVTDAGVRELARAETGLKGLTWLYLYNTQITDAGVKELARADTGLKGLTSLFLAGTRVTDAGVMELARAETGLKALSMLDLADTKVTDAGVKELARAETGLKDLTSLFLYNTQITDAGVKEVAQAETGLKGLTSLYLAGTKVTDAGVKELARTETGLKSLTILDIGHTKVTDVGVMELAGADTGLNALTSLNLGSTQVSDAGVTELARAETGLNALTSLYLYGTQVTDAGVKALARPHTGLKGLTALHLAGTKVTDVGVKALAGTDTGLNALTKLELTDTQVTDTGVNAVKERWPGIEVVR